MQNLLETININVNDAGGALDAKESQKYRLKYRALFKKAEIECPEPIRPKGKRGRIKKSKSRNLLERLRNYEQDTLRFMVNEHVPFSNNLAENDIPDGKSTAEDIRVFPIYGWRQYLLSHSKLFVNLSKTRSQVKPCIETFV